MGGDRFNKLSPAEADAEWQGDAERMLRAIGLQVAAIVEEILQAGLQIEAEMRREVIL